MQLFHHHSLKAYNSFSVDVCAEQLVLLETQDDLKALAQITINEPCYILGEGSNTLFLEDFNGTVIVPQLVGLDIEADEKHYFVTAAAGENWHHMVSHLLSLGVDGLENLALIPGSVGAAPIQNIGAYGVEFGDFCQSVLWYELATGETKSFTREQCQFGYRDSIFKRELAGKGIIVQVTLALPKRWQPELSYGPLTELARLAGEQNLDAKQIYEKVIAIRQSKLPDPVELPNAGSFFKNPVVDASHYRHLQRQYPNIPAYPQASGDVKLAAGWLIEQSGLKGYRLNDCQVHEKQALVLVNHGGSGQDILALARYIQQQVENKFSVKLIPEVRILNKQGAVNG